MKRQIVLGVVSGLALVCSSAHAQQPQQQQQQRQQQGGRQFGGGGFRGGAPMTGIIRQVDPARNALLVQMRGGETASNWVMLSPETRILQAKQTTLAELKPNETIMVTGVPTSITAAQIQIGEVTTPPPFGGFRGGGGPGGAAGGQGGRGGGAGRAGGGQMPGAVSSAQATGTVVTTNPLVLMLAGNVKVNVVAEPSVRVTRVMPGTITDLKVGDTVSVLGRRDDNDNLIAFQIQSGMDMGPGFGGGGGQGRGGRQGQGRGGAQ
jgi:hypothetical protein